ncbi:hypothetical protein NS14008_19625 [Nocardia seriolae]|nr:hypothetical protein NS14008_19625 [Nocardia seriolae]PSK28893.1 hypothetical protein C6575_23870 [Nocardia seriolae]
MKSRAIRKGVLVAAVSSMAMFGAAIGAPDAFAALPTGSAGGSPADGHHQPGVGNDYPPLLDSDGHQMVSGGVYEIYDVTQSLPIGTDNDPEHNWFQDTELFAGEYKITLPGEKDGTPLFVQELVVITANDTRYDGESRGVFALERRDHRTPLTGQYRSIQDLGPGRHDVSHRRFRRHRWHGPLGLGEI